MTNRRILYLDCQTGISGDMTVAALLDLGLDQNKLKEILKSLKIGGYKTEIEKTTKSAFSGSSFSVHIENHSHTHHHNHKHRHLSDIEDIINNSLLSDNAKRIALKIFTIIAKAEAKVHGISIDKVHFHEVGAIDSIVDIVSTAFCIDILAVDEIIVTGLNDGSGFVECQHGSLPVPVPAVLEIVSEHKVLLNIIDVQTELVTPTGAAIVAALTTKSTLPERFIINKIGIGFGKKDIGRANLLRALLIEAQTDTNDADSFYMLETNIDDGSSEQLGLVMEKLLTAGAIDVHYIPCLMKKSRPGYLLRVIVKKESYTKFEDIIFSNTTTIGIRRFPFSRTALERETIIVSLPYGDITVKKCYWKEEVFYYPEFESVKEVSEKSGIPYDVVFAAAKTQAVKDAK